MPVLVFWFPPKFNELSNKIDNSMHRQETPGGDTLIFNNILESIPACQAADRDSIPRRGGSAYPFVLLQSWFEPKKGQEESYLHWPGIEPHTEDKRACKVP